MSGNLVPERIVNKNGVRTTVYRKPVSAASKKTPALPPLTLVPKIDLSDGEIMESLSLKIRTACREQYAGVNDIDQPTINRMLKQYSQTTLNRLHAFLDSPGLNKVGSRESVTAHAVAKGENETFISDVINFLPIAGKSTLVRSLRSYPQLATLPIDTIDRDSDTFRRALALMETADFIRYTYESNYSEHQGPAPFRKIKVPYSPSFIVLNDSRVVDFILEHHEEAERIKDIIQERGSAEYEIIVAAWENGSALGAGTL